MLKTKNVFDRGKGELENAKGREHESILTFKMAFCCIKAAVFTRIKVERYSAYKTKVWNSLLCISHFQT